MANRSRARRRAAKVPSSAPARHLAEEAAEPSPQALGNRMLARLLDPAAAQAPQEAAEPAATGPITLSAPVGRGGANEPADVRKVVAALARAGMLSGPAETPAMIAAIMRFQREVVGFRRPDGRIDPGERTLRELNGAAAGSGGTSGPAAEERSGSGPAGGAAAAGGGGGQTAGELLEEVASHGTDVAPHGESDTGDGLPGPASGGGQTAAGDQVVTDAGVTAQVDSGHAGATTSAGGPPAGAARHPDVAAWLGRQPTTTPDLAAWLLAGEQHGFLKLRDFYRKQIVELGEGASTVTVRTGDGKYAKHRVDTSQPLGVLLILSGLVRGHARRWLEDPSKAKGFVHAGDLIRNLSSAKDAHRSGASADLYSNFDWQGARGPRQVAQALSDLPPGTYSIGLPFQGRFFPRSAYLAERYKAAKAAAAGGRPADITEPSLVYWSNKTFTATWDPDKPNKDGSRGGFRDRPAKARSGAHDLQDAELKTTIASLKARGVRISVFPDYDNHLHVTRQ